MIRMVLEITETRPRVVTVGIIADGKGVVTILEHQSRDEILRGIHQMYQKQIADRQAGNMVVEDPANILKHE